MSAVYILLAVLVGIIIYAISIYNSLQTIKTRITASIQEIGNQLKRQANLIPNLTESTKSYLKHEKGIFEQLTEARKAVVQAQKEGGSKIDDAVQQLNSVLPKLNILVESNPELKANTVIQNLMNELRDTADKLMYARRTLIDLTQNFNQKLVTFPSNIVASSFGFKPERGLETPTSGSHLEVSDNEMKDVKVEL